MNELLISFKEKLLKELKDIDLSSLYEDIDILGCISEYDLLQMEINKKDKLSDKKELEREILKIERECLKKCKVTKIVGEEKNYYYQIGEPYNQNGCIIEDYFEEAYEEDDIFCEYKGDSIYKIMKKNLEKKIKKYCTEE